MQPCPTCESLRACGVKPVEPDPSPWIDSPPSEASVLEVFGPGQGHSDTVQIRRCRECGALYRYRYHNEYDVTGSWEEYFLWKMSPEAQAIIRSILGLPLESRAEPLAKALHHAQPDVREDASLLLWISLDHGAFMTETLLEASCNALMDSNYMVGNYCYRALLGYLYRGKSEALALSAMLERLEIPKKETQFSWILIKDTLKLYPA